jgi:hypothetical protein
LNIIDDTTTKNIKEELSCQIFKVNYTCEIYIVNKSNVYAIGLGLCGLSSENLDFIHLELSKHTLL